MGRRLAAGRAGAAASAERRDVANINQLVQKIQSTDARRQHLRTRLLAEELSGSERASMDTELAALNHTIEQYASRLNSSISEAARRGQSPGKVRIGEVLDPELQQFLDQVRRTCEKLESLNGKAPASSSPEAQAVHRDRAQADRLKKETQKRLRECDDERKKTERARTDLDRDRERLGRERTKVEQQKAKLEEQRQKAQAERDQAQASQDRIDRERASVERDKSQLVTQLKGCKEARRRAQLEQQVTKANQKLQQAKQRLQQGEQVFDRYDRLLTSLGREIEQLDQALDRLKDEQARSDEEQKRLDERLQQIARAREVEQERLGRLDEVETSLTRAMA